MHSLFIQLRVPQSRDRIRLAILAALLGAVVLGVALLARGLRRAPVSIAQTGASGQGTAAGVLPSPELQLLASLVPQGGALAVELRSPSLAAASARFNGRDYPMIAEGELWFAVVGIGQAVGSADMLNSGDYPIDVTYQFAGSRAVQTVRLSLGVSGTDFPADAIEVGEEEALLLDPQLEAAEAAMLNEAYSGFTPVRLWQGPFAMPLAGAITTVFGARRSYQGGPASGSHSGVDIGVPLGARVGASAAGRVAWTGELPDRGRGVIVDHGLGVYSGYFHLSQIMSQTGQSVDKGDAVGLAGSTGLSTGPHVHWEIVVSRTNVDGLLFSQLSLP